ncbi:acyl carrier protein [Kitasatospora cineracea]|uniref:Acyl carrier protein n=1 Tax=Kitasatospora cineracea TaxID=88074 RepID=A0A3N4R2M2_9ACTN|nr:acyl carrier protein [Kitasatospora cineracea]RPE27803.1 acyl carrier protein [Kitasatospora cineracea]
MSTGTTSEATPGTASPASPVSPAEIRAFVLAALREMNYDTSEVDDDTPLGPAGADLESLALAELGVRVEERFGVRFEDDEAEQLGTMTVGGFGAAVAARLRAAAAGGPA